MDTRRLERQGSGHWRAAREPEGQVPVDLFGDRNLLKEMDAMVLTQARNVARLPGIVGAALAMPDAHWGYGFPIGGVAAFDPEQGGVISAGGVGFDIACGVRTLRTGLVVDDVLARRHELADRLAQRIPAGVGSTGSLRLDGADMDAMLRGGARWAVDRGYGTAEDLACIEEGGCLEGADPGRVSGKAKQRQRRQLGTLGSGNHYLEVQRVERVYDGEAAAAYGLAEGDILVSIHCGSRGLGHQIATDYAPVMARAAKTQGIALAERELACARLDSEVGRAYLAAMTCGIHCAVANRQVLTQLVREVFAEILPAANLSLLYDVSHNTCKRETHRVEGRPRTVYVHRKGATRAFGPGHPALPAAYRAVGQPVLIGGTMGTASHILAGTERGMAIAFGSCCHGAGRAMSRKQALQRWHGRDVVRRLAERDILIRGASLRGVAEEAPGAYKDVDAVVAASETAGLARRVARVLPLLCIKG